MDLIVALPWFHHVLLMEKVKDLATRRWYMEQTFANGWSRNILAMQIDAQAHARHGKARSNFAQILPPHESDLVQQTLKDPYIFDFLTLTEPFQERELETGLVRHLEKFLILCQEHSRLLAEYSFAGIDKPIGISTYELTRALPKEVRSALPTVEEIEAELSDLTRNAKPSRPDGKRGGLECREARAHYGTGCIAIVPAPFDATDGADTTFGRRWGGEVATLAPAHLAALKAGKTLALDVRSEYVHFVKAAVTKQDKKTAKTK